MTLLPLIFIIAFVQQSPEPPPEVRASLMLGARTAHVQRALPILNQVVVVPDEATYLDELSRWSLKGRWPVLFEREPFASQFIRTFSPEKVLRRTSIRKGVFDDIGSAMQRVVANAWGGEDSVQKTYSDLGLVPLGVVLTSLDDPARTAAVALAAGRGQLLRYMSGKWGNTNEILDGPATTSLLREIDGILSNCGEKYAEIGDTIDAITICQTMPARVTFSYAHENPVALSDVVGRNESGTRFAWTGWIFGSKANAAYIAMCSLFLERDQYWFCSTYPKTEGWSQYALDTPGELLPNYGISVHSIDGTLSSLQQAGAGGVTTDVIYFLSKGNQDFLDMADERTSPTWLPILNTPSVLYFLHSWSLKNPGGRPTVGGTWLSRGVYAYLGSSHEPTLGAFVPPHEVMRRTMNLIPFLVASRWYTGQAVQGGYANAWRLNTIGDPLMLCERKNAVQRTLLAASTLSDYEDLIDDAKLSAKVAEEKPSDVLCSSAIDAFLLIGHDEEGVAQWTAANDQGVAGSRCARAVLPALFRLQLTESFIWAFKLIASPTSLEKDMLWQLVGTSKTTPLQLLMKNLRKP